MGVGARFLFLNDRFGFLLISEAAGKCETRILFFLQDHRPCVFAAFRPNWFGAKKKRGDHYLISQDEVIDDAMVPIELPAPRLRFAGFSHDGEIISPTSVSIFPFATGQLSNGVVQLHDALRRRQALCAQPGSHHGKSQLTLFVIQFLKADALTGIGMLVGPLPPFIGIIGKGCFGALSVS